MRLIHVGDHLINLDHIVHVHASRNREGSVVNLTVELTHDREANLTGPDARKLWDFLTKEAESIEPKEETPAVQGASTWVSAFGTPCPECSGENADFRASDVVDGDELYRCNDCGHHWRVEGADA
jgi:hypothetical protein